MIRLQVVGWDLDGVLYVITPEIRERVNVRIYQEIAAGKSWSVEKSKDEFNSRYKRLGGATATLIDLGFGKETMQHCLESADILDILKYDHKLVRMFESLNSLRHILVTGSSSELSEQKLKRIGINDVFEHRITADDVENPKPHQESWLKLLNYTRLPAEAHGWVDDRIEHARVAKALGYRAGLVGNGSGELDFYVANVYDVEPILKSYAAAQ